LRSLVIHSSQDLDELLARFEWLEGPAQFEIGALPRRPPRGGNGAIGEENEGCAERRSGSARGQCAASHLVTGEERSGTKEAKKRHGNASPHATQEMTPATTALVIA